MIKLGKLLSVDDSGDYTFCSVSVLGKEQKALLFNPYGIMSNPPKPSMGVLFSQQGQESNQIAMFDDPKNRPLKNLADGEVAIGNYITGDYAYFDENGDLFASVTRDCTIAAARNITMTAVNVEVTSTTITHNGTNIGDDHVHPQANDSGGNTEQDTGGPQ